MHKLFPRLVSGLLCGLPFWAGAQAYTSRDSTLVAEAVQAATQQYVAAVQPESSLFNGTEYLNYAPVGAVSHQFFSEEKPQLGTVHYGGAYFENLLLNYDLVLNCVVLTYPSRLITISLPSERVSAFTLGEHSFVRLSVDSAKGPSMPTGFYEELRGGPLSLLALRIKVYQAVSLQPLHFGYRQTDRLFIKTATATNEVTNLKHLVALLPAHKADVQRYAHQQQLRFTAAEREASATKLLRYYFTLVQEP
jgi:hypothetical protein